MTLHTPPDILLAIGDPPSGCRSHKVHAAYEAFGSHTVQKRVFESGALRLRHPKGPRCEAVLVNTGGGIVSGDRLVLSLDLETGAQMTLTSAAAEKVYRSDLLSATADTCIALQAGSRLCWLPQETILFEGARFKRSFTIDLAAGASFLGSEILVFGRLAHGETEMVADFRDSWRIRREGHLVYADETRLEGALQPILARAAVAGGARACGLLIYAAADAPRRLDRVRAELDIVRTVDPRIEGAATVKDGIMIARLLAPSGEQLRDATRTLVNALSDGAMPRSWS